MDWYCALRGGMGAGLGAAFSIVGAIAQAQAPAEGDSDSTGFVVVPLIWPTSAGAPGSWITGKRACDYLQKQKSTPSELGGLGLENIECAKLRDPVAAKDLENPRVLEDVIKVALGPVVRLNARCIEKPDTSACVGLALT